MDKYPPSLCSPVTLHRYAYANSDPIQFLDPSGNFSLTELQIVQTIQGKLRKHLTRQNLRKYGMVALCGATHIGYKVAQRGNEAIPVKCYGTPQVLRTAGGATEYRAKVFYLTLGVAGRGLYLRLNCDKWWKLAGLSRQGYWSAVRSHIIEYRNKVNQLRKCALDAALLEAKGRF